MNTPSEVIDLTIDSPIIGRQNRVRDRLRTFRVVEEIEGNDRNGLNHRIPEFTVSDVSIPSEDKNETLPYINETCVGHPTLVCCPICFDPLSSNRKPMATMCGHMFCLSCLKSSLKARKHCPTCQKPVSIRYCIRLYFPSSD